MMNKLHRQCAAILLLPFFLILPLIAVAQEDSGAAAIPEPDWFKISFLELEEDVTEATQAGKHVMLYFYQDGCPYCAKLIKENFGREDIASFTQANFDTIALNIWGDRELMDTGGLSTTEKQFAKELGVQFTPTLLILDEQGDVAVRMNGLYPPDKFLRALQWGADKSSSDPGYKETLKGSSEQSVALPARAVANVTTPVPRLNELVRDSDRHLLVLFEEPGCADCDVLHSEIFPQSRVNQLLDDYHVVVVDATADDPLVTPEGEESSARAWAGELGIAYRPSMVFFDRTSREVFRTEAWLRAFHVEAALAYVAEDAYLETPQFQRFVDDRADAMRSRGLEPDLMQ